MTEQLTAPSLQSQESAVTQDRRKDALKVLFPYDYPYVCESGILDDFFYDPKTGEDAIIHILAGNRVETAEGSILVGGFHHEESGRLLSEAAIMGTGITRVDTSHLDGADSAKRRKYRRFPGEPYQAQVFIHGLKKIQHKGTANEPDLEPAVNTMFPEDYDGLTVIQMVRFAYHNRKVDNDKDAVTATGQRVLINQADVLMIDGKTSYTIRLVMDADTKKIKIAHPLNKEGGRMRLTESEYQETVRNMTISEPKQNV